MSLFNTLEKAYQAARNNPAKTAATVVGGVTFAGIFAFTAPVDVPFGAIVSAAFTAVTAGVAATGVVVTKAVKNEAARQFLRHRLALADINPDVAADFVNDLEAQFQAEAALENDLNEQGLEAVYDQLGLESKEQDAGLRAAEIARKMEREIRLRAEHEADCQAASVIFSSSSSSSSSTGSRKRVERDYEQSDEAPAKSQRTLSKQEAGEELLPRQAKLDAINKMKKKRHS
jgi:hypothetical protein